ncbi:beta-ketoacyl synthase N-terminal-like domain-containing protein [Marinobacter changyiensis]|uniref:beta-ketoacyl synthase N-terminal-like domain-containing protein n=1 Tax=Marinobacter changyiensis TaxID=2604091 RepID=UPI001264CAC4|nr:beta-ketoacyl synthase N-terminal-like domain-containing protein [Marinobacter changyiensis]
MGRQARISATGMISSLDGGVAQAARALLAGPERTARYLDLEGFAEPLSVPYHGVNGGPEDAGARLNWLLDEALAELFARVQLEASERASMPVFIGSSCYGIGIGEAVYRQQLTHSPALAMPLPLDGFGQISHHLQTCHGFTGPDFSLNTACTATANALISAMTAIRNGQCDRALIVGLEARNLTTLSGFHGMQLMAANTMRPFDRRRDGLILGEGCGVLLLEVDNGCAGGSYLSGGASNCDTYSISASHPDGSSIAAVMAEALADAGISRDQIAAIKAHGTATPLNDNSEAAGMRRLFDPVPDFFSLKSLLGHTLGSCGVMETILMDACLAQNQLPASSGFAEADSDLQVSPVTEARAAADGYYLLNFFGFGGNNASLVLNRQSRP